MMDAVHRYEGTVNQGPKDGIMALFGAPIAHEDHAVRACYAALAMQAAMRRYGAEGAPRSRAWRCRSVSASTLVRWWYALLTTTCIWTTPSLDRRRIWQRAWNNLPLRAAFA